MPFPITWFGLEEDRFPERVYSKPIDRCVICCKPFQKNRRIESPVKISFPPERKSGNRIRSLLLLQADLWNLAHSFSS
jgi:hypothetical protein